MAFIDSRICRYCDGRIEIFAERDNGVYEGDLVMIDTAICYSITGVETAYSRLDRCTVNCGPEAQDFLERNANAAEEMTFGGRENKSRWSRQIMMR